ncbi:MULTISPECIES: glycerophosphodiester phosphodiesterase family protein [Kordiimonas]|jgi:glycerophosphoryl diester phosphodiesterase|uniref:glycerophosphodiester phosphodiesterase family protein n=1 Tax=Kordiimonas TaxID=288021 RepID=UPI00257F8D07|nr:glycerophosphodiester phosphodiesterase family protein [Kordiimonas sp. UBA4487]
MANGKKASREFPWLTEKDVAHRGLHKPGTVTEENTIAAVSDAVHAGYAVEIDVRATGDDIIVVFHDDTIDRMTDGKGPVSSWGFQQLRKFMVGKSGKPIPSLPDVMDAVDGHVPLFIEIKSHPKMDIQKLCAGVRHSFEGYQGPVAVMSFDPRIVHWFKTYMPKYARGLVIGREVLLGVRKRLGLQLAVHKCKPDFLACDINLLPNTYCTKWRAKGKPLLTWTVRDSRLEAIGREHADAVIFEPPAVVGEDF